MRFTGKRILVTGGTRGIGCALSVSLATQGAEVIALGRSGSLAEPNDCPPEARSRLRVVECDLLDWEATRRVVQGLGQLDGVVNNAGIARPELIGSVTEGALLETFRVNLFAAINVSQAAAELMPRGASIVNVSSQTSFATVPRHASYAASKAALDAFTRSLALELGPRGIRSNCVNPGVVLTDMGRANWSDPKVAGAMLARVPLHRFVEVPEVVAVIEFLLSGDAAMVNGVALPVDGGVSINQL